jgi:hypothetical protein
LKETMNQKITEGWTNTFSDCFDHVHLVVRLPRKCLIFSSFRWSRSQYLSYSLIKSA